MDFWNENTGILFGDPINGQFFLAKTLSSPLEWESLTPASIPKALENEGGFAASGSSIQTLGDSTVYFGTGMAKTARLFCSYDRGENWVAKETPMQAGDSFGIYSLFFWSEKEGVIIGGSYKDSTHNKNICFYTEDGGDSWEKREKGLLGYCSSIHGTAGGEFLVATGRMGTFYSRNKGVSWSLLLDRSYYSCRVTSEHIVLAGRSGSVEILRYDLPKK